VDKVEKNRLFSSLFLYYYIRVTTTPFSNDCETILPVLTLSGNLTLAVIALNMSALGIYQGWMIDVIVKFV
jgi:hypothetical protein